MIQRSISGLFCTGISGFAEGEPVDIGIQGKERIGIVQGAEKLSLHLIHALDIELEVVPGLGIGDHVPAQRIRSVLGDHFKGIHRIAQAFRHFISVLVEAQAVADNILVSHRIKQHHGNGMQGEKPSAGLVHPFGNEIGRVILV